MDIVISTFEGAYKCTFCMYKICINLMFWETVNSYIYMYHLMDQKLSYESFFMTQTFYYELFNGANKQLGKYWYLD